MFIDASNCVPKYRIPPSSRYRLDRQKLRDLLCQDLNIQEGKDFEFYSTLPNGPIQAQFSDGTTATGSIIIGADGNNSLVRKQLLPETYQLTQLPINLLGVVRHFNAEKAALIRALDPLLFQALHPKTGNYLWYSIQDCISDSDGQRSFDSLVIISWLVKDEIKDAIPKSHTERIVLMKERSKNFAEPLRSIVHDIPADLPVTTALRLADFPCVEWDNQNGKVTLAGDSCHVMTMYRGEGANHGILDAALLVDQLKLIHARKVSLKEGIDVYEEEMRPRTHAAVLLSRQAALDAHEWDKVTDESPCIGARMPPATA